MNLHFWPPWVDYVIFGLGFVAFLIVLIVPLNWAWEKFFNYLGRNEIPDQEHDDTRT